MKRLWNLCLVSLPFLVLPSSVLAQDSYVVVDLGTLGGETRALGLNDARQVVGWSLLQSGDKHAIVWDKGVLTDLGTLPNATTSWAVGINNTGVIAGNSSDVTDTQGLNTRGVTWEKLIDSWQITRTLSAFGDGIINFDNWSEALGIGPDQMVAGWSPFSHQGSVLPSAAVWAGTVFGSLLDLNFCKDCHVTRAFAIDPSGQLAVGNRTIGNVMRAEVWIRQSSSAWFPSIFGPQVNSSAHAINSSHDFVGFLGNPKQAALWLETTSLVWNNTPVLLGTLGGSVSEALDINDVGQVVGTARSESEADHAFLWHDGVLNDLNELISDNSGWELVSAHGINSHGEIVGWGMEEGQVRAFLLVPFVAIDSSDPPDGAIDARLDQSLDGQSHYGWQTIDLIITGNAAGVQPNDFIVEEIGGSGTAPNVDDLIPLADNVLRIVLSEPIEAGAWTRVTHWLSGDGVQIGFLPGDVNGDRYSGPADILALIDSLNNVQSSPIWSTDINRSGVIEPTDILAQIDLLNGADALNAWNGRTLP